ncbi:MAG: recombinase family protein [Acetobacteraceae bacterium]
MPVLGYARVSTRPRTSNRNCANCATQGCAEIFEEKASGTSRAGPELARLLNRLRAPVYAAGAVCNCPGLRWRKFAFFHSRADGDR